MPVCRWRCPTGPGAHKHTLYELRWCANSRGGTNDKSITEAHTHTRMTLSAHAQLAVFVYVIMCPASTATATSWPKCTAHGVPRPNKNGCRAGQYYRFLCSPGSTHTHTHIDIGHTPALTTLSHAHAHSYTRAHHIVIACRESCGRRGMSLVRD